MIGHTESAQQGIDKNGTIFSGKANKNISSSHLLIGFWKRLSEQCCRRASNRAESSQENLLKPFSVLIQIIKEEDEKVKRLEIKKLEKTEVTKNLDPKMFSQVNTEPQVLFQFNMRSSSAQRKDELSSSKFTHEKAEEIYARIEESWGLRRQVLRQIQQRVKTRKDLEQWIRGRSVALIWHEPDFAIALIEANYHAWEDSQELVQTINQDGGEAMTPDSIWEKLVIAIMNNVEKSYCLYKRMEQIYYKGTK